ncbi:hypothetical protein LSAT2_001821 [Lamellibrachia satsuma]|nr:hypothetical protein LSAT2_001821 [Lamellibrachia satsuma]
MVCQGQGVKCKGAERVHLENAHNIAAGKQTHQSSVRGLNSANFAIDSRPETCAETLRENNSYWSIDLLEQHTITGLHIDSGNAVNTYLVVFVINSEGNWGFGKTICRYYSFFKGDNGYVQCSQPTEGRYVLITSPHHKHLTLCTVKILECDDGYFGLQCKKKCHCLGNAVCRKKDGLCDTGCDLGWKGVGCQYLLPALTEAPLVSSTTPTSMMLKWHAWQGYVAPLLKVIYRIQYNRHRHHGNGTKWTSRQDIIDPDEEDGYVLATLSGLQHNTFYMVRIRPLLLYQEKLLGGTSSPVAGPFRTKCAKPAAPYIGKIVTGQDDSKAPTSAMLSVKWESDKPAHRLLVVEVVGREQVGCASGSGGGGAVDDKVGEEDEIGARESSP